MPRNSLDPDPVSDFWLDLDSMNMDRKQCVQFIIIVSCRYFESEFRSRSSKNNPKKTSLVNLYYGYGTGIGIIFLFSGSCFRIFKK